MARSKPRSGLIAALDIGTAKLCCFIARVDKDGLPHVLGIGHNMSQGVKGGAIVDLDAAQSAVLAAVNAAEKMAGTTIDAVIVNLSGGQPTSRTRRLEVPLGNRPVGNAEIRRLADQKAQILRSAGEEVIHAIPLGFSVDGAPGMRDPRGLHGAKVGLDLHVVSAQPAAARNLDSLLARCHLEAEEKVVSPFAAGLAALTPDQRELGATVIDMGAGATSVAVFRGGQVVFTDSVPVGGGHVTKDIAYALSTSLVVAERMKTLHGSALTSPADDQEILEVPRIDDEDDNAVHQVPRSMLVNIIKPRVEETLEMLRDKLEGNAADAIAGRMVVLTGGAAQLSGISELAGHMFNRPATIARPHGVAGLAEATGGPAFSVCAGLLHHAVQGGNDPLSETLAAMPAPGGPLGRIGAWLKENF